MRFVLSFGLNEDGQSGSENTNRIINTPTPLSFGPSNLIQISMISAGSRHSLALSTDGQVFSWGWGLLGQLGHNSTSSVSSPLRIEKLSLLKIEQISSGGMHSGCITSDGDVYCWGSNSHGQLGIGDLSQSVKTSPTRVHFHSDQHQHKTKSHSSHVVAMRISCGGMHTMICDSLGCVYGWGRADSGQTGISNWYLHGSNPSIPSPRRVQFDFVSSLPTRKSRTRSSHLLSTIGSTAQLASSLSSNSLSLMAPLRSRSNSSVSLVGLSLSPTASSSYLHSLHPSLIPTSPIHPIPTLSRSDHTDPLSPPSPASLSISTTHHHHHPHSHHSSPAVSSEADLPSPAPSLPVPPSPRSIPISARDDDKEKEGEGEGEEEVHGEVLDGCMRIVDVACGSFHSLLLSSAGVVYSMGRDDFGVLGTGRKDDDLSSFSSRPTIIEGLVKRGAHVTHISAGGWHSLFRTSDGQVFACGKGEYGRLGTGTAASCDEPTLILFPSPSDPLSPSTPPPPFAPSPAISSKTGGLGSLLTHSSHKPKVEVGLISAGGSHSLFSSLDNHVMATGRSDEGRLGFDSSSLPQEKQRLLKPQPILTQLAQIPELATSNLDLSHPRILDISAGGSHSLVLVEFEMKNDN